MNLASPASVLSAIAPPDWWRKHTPSLRRWETGGVWDGLEDFEKWLEEEDWEEEDRDSDSIRGIQPIKCSLKALKRPNAVALVLSTKLKNFGPVPIILRAIEYGNFPGAPRPHMI